MRNYKKEDLIEIKYTEIKKREKMAGEIHWLKRVIGTGYYNLFDNKKENEILKKYNTTIEDLKINIINEYIRNTPTYNICEKIKKIEDINIEIIDDFIIKIKNKNWIVEIDNEIGDMSTTIKKSNKKSTTEINILVNMSEFIINNLFIFAIEYKENIIEEDMI